MLAGGLPRSGSASKAFGHALRYRVSRSNHIYNFGASAHALLQREDCLQDRRILTLNHCTGLPSLFGVGPVRCKVGGHAELLPVPFSCGLYVEATMAVHLNSTTSGVMEREVLVEIFSLPAYLPSL